MLKKAAVVAAIAAGTIAVGSPALAAGKTDHPKPPHQIGLINVGGDVLNNLCVAPWYWNGPITLNLGTVTSYTACNGNEG
ncbi:hypothetical protein EV193_101312 [Herbihabitans rhizosphaerae]|uniref:Small secreted domain DUF320 n=1 Tax=Herbihabitans rhizosphaerae TaxID=1872711 RepID=A0A4Q7L5C8_9PSEU|nr:hypothetical protein [Herbihabitans rhizosphaerae]RZS44436.1 hypothetical protein EV193_101312 [Herbihabitans rhizosphaerae]